MPDSPARCPRGVAGALEKANETGKLTPTFALLLPGVRLDDCRTFGYFVGTHLEDRGMKVRVGEVQTQAESFYS